MMSNAEKRIHLKEPADRGAGAGEADSGKTLTVTNDLLESQPDNRLSQDWKDRVGLATVAACLIIAAVAWYLLKEFAPLLRPLLLAVFLCYIILPIHRRLIRRIPAVASIVLLAGVSVGLLVL